MATAGYSGTPLAKKLGIKEGHVVGLFGVPGGRAGVDTFVATLDGLPDAVEIRTTARGPLDVLVSFHTSRAHFEKRVPVLVKAMARNGGLWIAWPKRASGVATDMTEDVVREVALPLGLVDNKVCAIDETWSGLRVVWRLANR